MLKKLKFDKFDKTKIKEIKKGGNRKINLKFLDGHQKSLIEVKE